MSVSPLVSIIIPTFNRAHMIGETLESVIAQTYTNWECLVIDDGSSDETDIVMADYTKNDTRFFYFQRPSETIKGASACRNYGLSKSTGDYIIFLDSDDLLLKYCLSSRVAKQKRDIGLDFYVFPMYIKRGNSKEQILKIPDSKSYLIDFLSCNVRWQTMCTMWKTTFIKELEGFNAAYPRLNDPEIHIRAMLMSGNRFKVYVNALPDSVYREARINDKHKFAVNYAKSLLFFIPDITKSLKRFNLLNYRFYLKGYLRHYFLNFYNFNSKKNNSIVAGIFYKNRIISIFSYCKLLSYYYLFLIFNKILKRVKQTLEGSLNQL
ncbi:glycosyltransferase family 2 protein [Aestuariibaculum suncheonense]|uniref:Glycosyltransferase family 2 protein n=1 Tax=Aestuariibaculum suncheonense TaxID=1028745 RepID=A0A8J6QAB1_9FLAO|nr:glycosyltransferase family 2 protein [Aestuariibaculum suncheonense]MBD0837023.1 glycosyltransferase family 2 protein [Aestuariibaculum suncheonense]